MAESQMSEILTTEELLDHNIDFSFIEEKEGYSSTPYVPKNKEGKALDKSGVTIGSGVDLGQQTEKGLLNLGVSSETVTKLKPFLGKKGDAAIKALEENNASIDSMTISDIQSKVYDNLFSSYINYYEKETGKKFKDLNPKAQTAIGSVISQYGPNLKKRTPKFNKAIIDNNIPEMKKELENFGDKYPTRRQSEASLLEGLSFLNPFHVKEAYADEEGETFTTEELMDDTEIFTTEELMGDTEIMPPEKNKPTHGATGEWGEYIQQAKPQTIIDKIKAIFTKNPEERIAEAQNIYAISKQTGIPIEEVSNNIDTLSRSKDITGIKPDNLTNQEFTSLVFAPFIGAGAMSAPLTTALSIGTYSALDKIIDLKKFVPSDVNNTTKTLVELADFTVKGAIAGKLMHGLIKNVPNIVETLFQKKVTELKLPKNIKLSSKQVRKALSGEGKGEGIEILKSLEEITGNKRAIRNAVDQGVDVVIPGEKIIKIVDKPGWKKFKNIFGIKETSSDILIRTMAKTKGPIYREGIGSINAGIKSKPENKPSISLPTPEIVQPKPNMGESPPTSKPNASAVMKQITSAGKALQKAVDAKDIGKVEEVLNNLVKFRDDSGIGGSSKILNSTIDMISGQLGTLKKATPPKAKPPVPEPQKKSSLIAISKDNPNIQFKIKGYSPDNKYIIKDVDISISDKGEVYELSHESSIGPGGSYPLENFFVMTPEQYAEKTHMSLSKQRKAEESNKQKIKKQELDKFNKEVEGNKKVIEESSNKIFNKKFSNLNPAEKRKVLDASSVKGIVPLSEKEATDIAKVPSLTSDIDRNKMFMGDRNDKYLTNGIFLIIDKDIAVKERNKFWSKVSEKEIKKFGSRLSKVEQQQLLNNIKSGKLPSDIQQERENIAGPDYSSVIPTKKGNFLEYIGTSYLHKDKKSPELIKLIYSDGKNQISLNSSYVKYIKNYFPESVMMSDPSDPNKPVQFWQDGELKAILMPIKMDRKIPVSSQEKIGNVQQEKGTSGKEALIEEAKKDKTEKEFISRLQKDISEYKNSGQFSSYWESIIEYKNKLLENIPGYKSEVKKLYQEARNKGMSDSGALKFIESRTLELQKEFYDNQDKRLSHFWKQVQEPKNKSTIQKADYPLKEELSSKNWQKEMPVEPETKGKINKTKILDFAQKYFNVTIRGKATFSMKKAAGYHFKHKNLVRLKRWGELEPMTHEVAHAIDEDVMKQLGKQWRGNLAPRGKRKEIINELANLDYDKKARRTSEGFAEFMRHWLTNTGEAPKRAPNFYKYFVEDFFPKNPKLAKGLNQLKNMLDVWYKQGAENRILQHIDFRGEHTKSYFGISDKLDKTRNFIQNKFFDEFYTIKDIEDKIGIKSRKNIRPTKDPFEMATYMKSKSGTIARTFVMESAIDEYGKPVGKSLVEVLKPIKKEEINSFIAYAVSKRAKLISQKGKESGFDIQDANYIINKYKNETWDKTIDGLTEWSNHLLDWVTRAGGLTEKDTKIIRLMNPIYLPFKRAFVDTIKVNKGVGGIVNRGQSVKSLKGSGRPIINPLEAMIQQSTEMIQKAQKLHLARLVAELAQKEDVGGFISEVPAPMGATNVSLDKLIGLLKQQGFEDILSEDIGELSQENIDNVVTIFSQKQFYGGKDNIVSVWMNGKRKFYELHPDLYRAISGVDMLQRGPLLKILAPFSRLLRLGATQLKPSFGLIRNPFRDAFTYAVFSQRKTSTVFDPVVGIYKDIFNKKGDMTWRFKSVGGEMSGIMGYDRGATMTTYDLMLDEKLKGFGKVLKVVKHPVNSLRQLLQIPELGPRITEFENMYKKYLKDHPEWTEEDAFVAAFNDAQDITVNFTRSGSWGKRINESTAFFNAGMQGLSKLSRSFQKNPIRTLVKGIGFLTTLAMFNWWKNKDKQWYKNLAPGYKYNNLFFEVGKEVIRLPVPFDLGVIFMSAPLSALDVLYFKDKKYVEGLINNIAAQMPEVLPSALTPLLDVEKNKNYLGIPIESEGMKYLPITERKKWYTSNMATALSKGLSRLGFEKYSPIQIDYLLNQYTGGFVRNMQPHEIKEMADIPVLGDILLRSKENPTRQLNNFFNDWEYLSQRKTAGILTKEEKVKYNEIKSAYYDITRKYLKSIRELRKDNAGLDKIKEKQIELRKYLEKKGY